jgi:hypothetical protein
MKTDLSKIITTYAVCEFIDEVYTNNRDISGLNTFSEQCEVLGGNRQLFLDIATREMEACRLLEQEGGAPVSTPPTNVVAGVAGLKPEDLAVPVSAQKRHTSRNSIFKRKKPNTYYNDQNNSY